VTGRAGASILLRVFRCLRCRSDRVQPDFVRLECGLHSEIRIGYSIIIPPIMRQVRCRLRPFPDGYRPRLK
jgi:hypothetical protein